MFGAYAIQGTRSDANVPFRSLIQLDLDSEVRKDKETGQIIEVMRTAPTLDESRAGIDEFEWVAASSHSHDPQQGIVKYRIIILPDRNIEREEWKPLLEALQEPLHGALDEGAWPWSQAFYLPSCPEETKDDAFFEHNEGMPLPVDDFVKRGREIIAERAALNPRAAQRSNLSLTAAALPETPDNIARVKEMLTGIDPDVLYPEWRQVCWSVMATGWACAETLIREWSGAGTKFNETRFSKVVRDFDPSRGTGFGSLVYYARKNGWVAPSPVEEHLFTGTGADVTNGKIFADMFRYKLLHIDETGEWLRFDDESGWLAAPPGEVDRAAKEALEEMRSYAAEQWKNAPGDEKPKQMMRHVQYTSKAPNLYAMIKMAKSEADMTVRLSEFDADPMLLGVANGVLDLRDGTLLPVSPDVRVSKRCNVVYDPEGNSLRFDQFLREVQPDPEVRAFLQRFVGYCLTGLVNEQKFAFLYGHGANGKSVFIELIAWLLGDYARRISTEMLMHHQRSPQGPSPDIVALKGTRFIFANETEEGRRLDEARIKDLTGGDTLTGRAVYGKAFISFRPSHKLLVAGNHRPEIGDTSEGMWRRVILVPFEQTIPEGSRDPKLLERLKREGAGVLNWALEGLRDWQTNGLNPPPAIKEATAAYRDEEDIIAEWIGEKCTTGPGLREARIDLYFSYKTWCEANGHHPLAQSRLTRRLRNRGYEVAPDKRTVLGIALNNRGGRLGRLE
ncbi:MAG: phage/plasmid primase, P4 family [Methylovirgula sp.]